MSNTETVLRGNIAQPCTRWEPEQGDVFRVPACTGGGVDLVMLTDEQDITVYITGCNQGEANDKEDLHEHMIRSNLVETLDLKIYP